LSDTDITITDGQWSAITKWTAPSGDKRAENGEMDDDPKRARRVEDARVCLESALTLYSQRSKTREKQPRASKTKKDLWGTARLARKLRKALDEIDPYALLALGDAASKLNSEQTRQPEALRLISHPRMETVHILSDLILRIDRLISWAEDAAGQIENMQPGASEARVILDYFVWQAAMVFEFYTNRQFSNCMKCRAYLRALLDVVDCSIHDDGIEEAAKKAEVLLSEIRSQK
jgi:hypothetical protein